MAAVLSGTRGEQSWRSPAEPSRIGSSAPTTVKENLVTETKKSSGSGFTAEERAAMRERNKELKTQQSKEAELAAVLDKILARPEPPGYRQRVERPKSKLGPFMGVVDAILEDDKQAPAKQRHTARRIFDRLSDEHGYSGSEVTVRRYLALHKRASAEVFVPLSQPPGEAQFDFGEATVEIEGIRVKAALAVMALPYCDAFFVSASPR